MPEFDELLEKYKKFQEYEKTRFLADTKENQDLVIHGLYKMVYGRMGELWNLMTNAEKQCYERMI